jgi:hypothetical protein
MHGAVIGATAGDQGHDSSSGLASAGPTISLPEQLLSSQRGRGIRAAARDSSSDHGTTYAETTLKTTEGCKSNGFNSLWILNI